MCRTRVLKGVRDVWQSPELGARPIRRAVSLVVLGLYGVLVAGCGVTGAEGADQSGGGQGEVATETAAATTVGVYESVECTAPDLVYDEYWFPANMHLKTCSERYAVLYESATDREMNSLRLLDFETGENAVLVQGERALADNHLVLGAACSDDWLVWEEMSGNEYEDPFNVHWRVLAAPIEDTDLSLGESVLVTQSVTAAWSRPLMQVVGDTLYWMNNAFPNPRQESVAYRSRVVAHDLGTGASTEVYGDIHMTHVFQAQGDDLVVVRSLDNWTSAMECVVSGLQDGVERLRVDLQNTYDVAHWPAYQDGNLLWSADDGPDELYPSVFLRDSSGERYRVSEAGCDPCFVAGKVVHEEDVLGAPGGVSWPSVKVLDLETHQRYTLIKTSGVSDEVWWHLLPGQPASDSRVVIFGHRFNDEPAFFIRRYTLE